jgi:hypothetical protein
LTDSALPLKVRADFHGTAARAAYHRFDGGLCAKNFTQSANSFDLKGKPVVQSIRCSFIKRRLADHQGHRPAVRIADDRMDRGLFHSDAAFQSDAMRFYCEIQSTARAVAGRLPSMNRGWSSRRSKLNQIMSDSDLQKSRRAMTAALSDGGFQQHRPLRTPGALSIHGILKSVAAVGSSRTGENSIRSLAPGSITIREPGGVRFIETEVSHIAAFKSLSPTKPKWHSNLFKRRSPVSIPSKRKPCTQRNQGVSHSALPHFRLAVDYSSFGRRIKTVFRHKVTALRAYSIRQLSQLPHV